MVPFQTAGVLSMQPELWSYCHSRAGAAGTVREYARNPPPVSQLTDTSRVLSTMTGEDQA